VSYRLTVWELVPTSLTAEEVEEMEYELSYEEVPDEDLRLITAGYHEVWGSDKPDWMADSPTGEEGADASHESCANVEDGLEDEDSGDDQELARYIDSSTGNVSSQTPGRCH
jgi:hypothetical protein